MCAHKHIHSKNEICNDILQDLRFRTRLLIFIEKRIS